MLIFARRKCKSFTPLQMDRLPEDVLAIIANLLPVDGKEIRAFRRVCKRFESVFLHRYSFPTDSFLIFLLRGCKTGWNPKYRGIAPIRAPIDFHGIGKSIHWNKALILVKRKDFPLDYTPRLRWAPFFSFRLACEVGCLPVVAAMRDRVPLELVIRQIYKAFSRGQVELGELLFERDGVDNLRRRNKLFRRLCNGSSAFRSYKWAREELLGDASKTSIMHLLEKGVSYVGCRVLSALSTFDRMPIGRRGSVSGSKGICSGSSKTN
jgi:hypothetical protein